MYSTGTRGSFAGLVAGSIVATILIAIFEKNDPKWLDKNYEYFQSEIMDHLLKYNTTVKNSEHFLREIRLHTK